MIARGGLTLANTDSSVAREPPDNNFQSSRRGSRTKMSKARAELVSAALGHERRVARVVEFRFRRRCPDSLHTPDGEFRPMLAYLDQTLTQLGQIWTNSANI